MAAFPTFTRGAMLDGYREPPVDNVLRSPMESGSEKTRLKSSSKGRPLGFSVMVSDTEYATFEAFFRDDTASGALSFTMNHPRTAAPITCKFMAPHYEPVFIRHDLIRLTLHLEILP